MKRFCLIMLIMTFTVTTALKAQFATVKGFVYDAETGQSIPLASVWVSDTYLGTTTDQHGFFNLPKIPVGEATLIFRFLGYQDHELKLQLDDGMLKQVTILLKPAVIEIEMATISAERQRLEKANPVASFRLTPKTLQRLPSMSGQADLAEYLQVLPGVIFTGDRGGQLYIRGGEPVNNLVKLDGMTVINPFHSVGFTSVFDTETIGSIDVYTAGFGAQYGGRISSVIDIHTRVGNRNKFSADASANTFGYRFLAEGPFKKMSPENASSVSFMLSNKGSYIKTAAPTLYPWLDSLGLPFNYQDTYGKISFVGKNGDQLDLVGMRFSDAADYSGLMKSSWTNTGGGARALVSPRGSQLLLESSLYLSDYQGLLQEEGKKPRKTSYNSVEAAFHAHYNLPLFKLQWGTEMNAIHTVHYFLGTNGTMSEDEYFTTEILTFLEAKFETPRLLIEPGFRLNYYADRTFLSPEPRFKLKYKINKILNLNIAGGLYTQDLVSTTSTEDVVNMFQGYYIGPFFVKNDFKGVTIKNKFQKAWHIVGGLHYLNDKNLKLSAEVYFKDFYRMINYNRYRVYSEVLWVGDNWDNYITPLLTKYFIFETGLAYGIDLLAEWSNNNTTLYGTYSLGWAHREDELTKYLPHFDRRHNLNLVGGYNFGKRNHLSTKIRWNIGSGFPFTQSLGLYEDITLIDGQFYLDPAQSANLAVWYGPINEGRLPWYHRLDFSFSGTWKIGTRLDVEGIFSVMNLYNRQNVFYFDRVKYARVDQLPVIPTVGIRVKFK